MKIINDQLSSDYKLKILNWFTFGPFVSFASIIQGKFQSSYSFVTIYRMRIYDAKHTRAD